MTKGQEVHLQNITLSETESPVIATGVVARVYKKFFSVNVGGKTRDFSLRTGMEISVRHPAWRVLVNTGELEEVSTKRKEIEKICSFLSSKLAYSMQVDDLQAMREITEKYNSISKAETSLTE
jgi:hypothetical protein